MYQEVSVLLRFESEKGINLDDVRTFLRHQGSVHETHPLEICYGELVQVDGAPWTRQWEAMKSMGKVMDQMFGKL